MLAVREVVIRNVEKHDFAVEFTGDAVCPVKAGDPVVPSTVLFEGNMSELLQTIDLSKELTVPLKDVAHFLTRSDGEIVDKGDILAQRTVSMGIAEHVATAGFDGRLSYERLPSGVIDIMSPFDEAVVTAGMEGRVKYVIPGKGFKRQIMLTVQGYVTFPVFISGESASGDLYFIKDGDSIYRASDVDRKCKGSIVIAGRLLDLKLYEAIVEAGAMGVIVGGIRLSDLSLIQSGAIPVFVTEGWGVIPIKNILMEVFRSEFGSPVYLDVKNRHIFIYPRNKLESEGKIKSYRQVVCSEGDSQKILPLKKGMNVQLWDLPYWGYSGEIVGLLEDEELIQVEFSSGKKVVIDPAVVRILE